MCFAVVVRQNNDVIRAQSAAKKQPSKVFRHFSATVLQVYLWKRSTSKCQVKYDSVKKRRNYRLLNMTAYRFFSIKNA